MKKTLLAIILSVSLLNTSCASIMTNLSEKKDPQVIETKIIEKKLIKADIKPEYSVEDKKLKVSFISNNTYSAGKEETIKYKKNPAWVWGLGTLGLGLVGGLSAPVYGKEQSTAILSIGAIALAITAADYLYTFNNKEIIEKNIIKSPDINENIALNNANIKFSLGGNNFQGFTDKNGLFLTEDINYKTIDKKDFSKITLNFENKDYNFDIKTNEIWDLFAYNDPEYIKKPKFPPILDSNVAFSEPSGTGYLNANEEGFITVKVKNSGKGDALNLNIKITDLSNSKGLVFEESTKIARIIPNASNEIKIPIRAEKNISDKDITLKVEVTEPFYGSDADPTKISFKTMAIKLPDLEVSELGLEDEVGGKFTLGKETSISAIIRNKGKGKAENVVAKVNIKNSNVSYLTEKEEFELGNIEAGEWKKITFSLFANKKYNEAEIPFTINLSETRTDKFKIEKVKIAVNKPMSKMNELVVTTKNIDNNKTNNIQSIPSLNVDVDTDIPNSNVINKNGIAVIIGNKDYQNKDIPTVNYALRDSMVIKEYVKNVLGYKEENIFYLENATQGDFIKLFGNKDNHKGKLSNYIDENKSEVFVYYSGHGAPDVDTKSAYFVPSDTDPSTLALNGYSLETFYDNLGKLKAKSITVVIDSCFSGGSEKGMVIKSASPIFIDVKNNFKISDNMSVLTSSTGEQISSWYEDKKHSLFTYYFLKALQLGNKVDEDGDSASVSGNITMSNIHKYISEKVKKQARRMYGREQSPQLLTKEPGKSIFKW